MLPMLVVLGGQDGHHGSWFCAVSCMETLNRLPVNVESAFNNRCRGDVGVGGSGGGGEEKGHLGVAEGKHTRVGRDSGSKEAAQSVNAAVSIVIVCVAVGFGSCSVPAHAVA